MIVRGKTSGGVEVESDEWRWNIELIERSIDPMANRCEPFEDAVCSLGQDGYAYACDPTLVDEP